MSEKKMNECALAVDIVPKQSKPETIKAAAEELHTRIEIMAYSCGVSTNDMIREIRKLARARTAADIITTLARV